MLQNQTAKSQPTHYDQIRTFSSQIAVAVLLLLFGLGLIYSNSLDGDWHLDDFDNIVTNRNVHLDQFSWSAIQRSFYGFAPEGGHLKRPLAYFSFAINYYLGQLDVKSYHVVNLTIHYLAALMIYLLLRVTLALPAAGAHKGMQGHAMALLGAFLWAIHPIQMTAVTYIVQRMASMAALFSFVALYGYIRGRLTEVRIHQCIYFGISVVAAALAFFSKENAIVLPFSILAYELMLLRGPDYQIKWKHGLIAAGILIALGLTALVYADMSAVFQGYATRPFTLYERLLTQPRVIFYYISLLCYPVSSRFTLLHDFTISQSLWDPWTTMPAIIGILAMCSGAILLRRRWPLACFAILFFVLNHAVEGSVLPLELVFEHRNYLPAAFLSVLPVVLMTRLMRSERFANGVKYLAMGAAVVIIIALGHTTYMRNDNFRDEVSLWADNVKKMPRLHRPLNNFGRALMLAGQPEAGVAYLKEALTAKGLARINQHFISHYNLGLYYVAVNAIETAKDHFSEALRLRPGYARTYNQMALVELYQGRLASAQKYLQEALRLESDRSEFRYTLSMLRLRQGQPLQAIAEARKAQQIDPNDSRPLYLIAEAHRYDGQMERAIWFFNAYRERNPNELAPYLALVELHYLQQDWVALTKTARTFWHRIDVSQLSEVLQTYDLQYSALPRSRLIRIVRGLQKALQQELAVVEGAEEALEAAANPN